MAQGANPHGFVQIGGEIGVLIVNQSAESQGTASQLAQFLHQAKHSVAFSVPGDQVMNWGDLREHEWNSWLQQTQNLMADLHDHCESVFVVGISMGAPLALRLAELYSADVDGLIIVEPSFPNVLRSQRSLWSPIRSDLGKVVQPLIQIYSSHSQDDSASNAAVIADNISSPFIRELVLDPDALDTRIVLEETASFIKEVGDGLWLSDSADESDFDDSELINAEFQSIVEGLSLDESAPTTYLDQLEYLENLENLEDIEHFNEPNPVLEPIADPRKRRAIAAMICGPLYTIFAGVTYFDPLGIEPWPGILTFLGGLGYFFYALRDTPPDDDGAIL